MNYELLSEIGDIKKTFEILSDVEIKYALTTEAMERVSKFLHEVISVFDDDGDYNEVQEWEDVEWEINRWLFKNNLVLGKCNCDVEFAWGYIDKVLTHWS